MHCHEMLFQHFLLSSITIFVFEYFVFGKTLGEGFPSTGLYFVLRADSKC